MPVIAIDPKGDLGNLLLTFPRLSRRRVPPWIDEDEARRAGVTRRRVRRAAGGALGATASRTGGRTARASQRLRDAADFAIYTPGSRAGRAGLDPELVRRARGRPNATMRSCWRSGPAAPRPACWSLAGVDAAAAQPRAQPACRAPHRTRGGAARDLDLAALIQQVQSPPFDKVGVLDLESFFPAKERFELAMQLNGLLAAPGFEPWLEGEPLDPGALLYTPDGQPRVAVFSIAHLGDAERMFFVSLLLNQIVAWMRAQTGTTSLRALLYMDEIFGYFPPVANPPSKAPLLTLLKQARAFGLGVVLATQNPVDLDYKGLAQHRHLVPRPAADRTRQGARARRPGRGRRPDARSRRGRSRCSRRWRSACSCCTTCTTRSRRCSRRDGRCRTCGGRCRATRSRR